MGLPKWDFNQRGWASNIAIVSGVVSFGILTTLLTGPEMCLLDKRAYTYLGLFFPALVTLAPVVSLLQQKKIELEPTIALKVLFVVIFYALPVYSWLTMNAAVRSQPHVATRQSFRVAIDDARDSG